MNYFEILVIVLFILSGLIGYKRGFIRSVFKVLLTGLSLVLAYLIAPFVSNFICNNTAVDDKIRDTAYEIIEDAVQESIEDGITDIVPGISSENKEKLSELFMKIELTKTQQNEFIDKLKVPDFVKKNLKENNNKAARDEMGADNFYEYLAAYVTKMIINSLAFLITYIVFVILSYILYIVSAVTNYIPVLNGVNRLGGLVMGILEALIAVWVIMILVAFFISSDFGNAVYKQIEDSSFLNTLYDKNIFMNLFKKY